MSGDVQPRKRKDKKRKRDSLDRKSEDDLLFSRKTSVKDDEPKEQHQGVHGSKMGTDDVHLHIQGHHETGGHWCAKIFFFSLLAVLFGLIGLIILENRGLADLDTPLSESRFSNYFNGWVDEHRSAHEEHDVVQASIEEHEHDDEPFEEEGDHSEVDEGYEGDEEDNDQHDDGEDDTQEDEDADEDAPEATGEDSEDDNAKSDEDNEITEEVNDDNDLDDDGVNDQEEENESATEQEDINQEEEHPDDDDDIDDNTDEVPESVYVRTQFAEPISTSAPKESNGDDDDDDNDGPLDEEDDDGTFESLESLVVNNDAEELALLKEKARHQEDEAKKGEPEVEDENPSYTSSLAVKIGVGVALALVARLVLVRKVPNTNEPPVEIIMKRRLTIASPEDSYPEEPVDILDDDHPDGKYDYSGVEEEYSEEEIIEEEEIEVTDDEYDERVEESKNAPRTFEQFNAMYRPKGFEQGLATAAEEKEREKEKKESPSRIPVLTSIDTKTNRSLEISHKTESTAKEKSPQLQFSQYYRNQASSADTKFLPSHNQKLAQSQSPGLSQSQYQTRPQVTQQQIKTQSQSQLPAQVKSEIEPPIRSQTQNAGRVAINYEEQHEDDIEYEEEEIDDDEELDEEEEDADDEDYEEEVSDVDDTELMNRLDAKYGRLPASHYDSDEDGESWTKIKPRGGGPQVMDDDEFDEELRRANEEMLRESFNSALTKFETLSKKFPDKPEAFLGVAKVLDKQSQLQRSNSKLIEAIEFYKRYLAFGDRILSDEEFCEIARRCIDRMRFMGLSQQAVAVHESLIERFPKDASIRNELVVTYLLVNRLLDAKHVLEEILLHWPYDGFALVHYGFVLKHLDKNLPLAVEYLKRGIDSQANGTQDGRFYFNLGDSLLRLGRTDEARDIFKRGAALHLYPSEYQRSLYNVMGLRAEPFWTKQETGYEKFLNKIENNWKKIRREGLAVLSVQGDFRDENENLRDVGGWQQFELFTRGQRMRDNCNKTPITCELIETFPAARFCKRGQVKFSVMHPGTHVWPHCGPTNCRLRAHLGLSVPSGTSLRVANENRSWEEGSFLIFDDSFEHEVWHNGTALRLILIIDIWHPDLIEEQRQNLSPI